MYEVRPVSLHGVLATLAITQARGVPDEIILGGAGRLPDSLTDPDATITMEQELVVFDNARRAIPEQHLGLLIGSSMPISTLGLLGYTLLAAPTLGEALNCALQFPIQLASQFAPHLLHYGNDQHFVGRDCHGFFEGYSFSTDVFLSATLRVIRDCLQSPQEPFSAHFKRPPPSDLAPYRQLFGGDIQFSSHSDSLKLPKALLNQRLPLADPISHLAMLKLTQARERELETSAGSAIAHEVSTLLKSDIQRYSDLKAVAQALNISERTLRRRLAERTVTFKRLQSMARHQLANRLLSSTHLSLDAISQQLGFADPSSFVHAYHKWAGVSPGRFRRSLRS
ncbi:AraC family transcriptional regulator ligand-binding domain-containing protein [Pseudomonas sp. MPFS]|uniref:AraC family transcriptional regulator n=1 Tax=Pseudomonas sp. MPFS TaxID=2795724 RepID=UPI001F14735B|nr:AraC family transcriptional regulator [Pseudomonas sp. MPFS]UMZ09467.1 AraC family transcriptional regulator ligand-binding domain-containing protein [Pseudomonas sp. MPFS]